MAKTTAPKAADDDGRSAEDGSTEHASTASETASSDASSTDEATSTSAPDVPEAGDGDGDGRGDRKNRHGSTRPRRLTAWLLIVLAAFLTFGTAADIWVKQQLLSTPRWVKLSDEILAQPKVQASLATYLVDEIYSNVDVQQAISEQLPDNFKGLSGPLAGALRGPATTGVEKLLASSQVRSIWTKVNTATHKTLVNVLEDKMQYGSSASGKVVLDLGEIVRAVATQIGLPTGIVDKIPADIGQVTIFQSDQLAVVQTSIKILRVMGPILVVVVLALFALAVWINKGRRIRTLRNVGWSVLVVGLLLVLLRKVLGNYVVSMIPSPQYVPTGGLVWSIVTRMLNEIGWILAGWGALIVVGMLFVGPSRPARAVRRFLAPVINAEPLFFWGIAGVLYLFAVLTSPSPSLQVWWSVLIVGALAALYLEVLRRRTIVEFPDRHLQFDGIGGRASHLWGEATGWAKGIASRATDRRPPPPDAPAAPTLDADPVAQLQRLTALHDSGALSDDEFAAAKKKLLG